MFAKKLLLTIALICVACVAFAAVPPMISYQGKLMQPSGAQVPDGTYSIQFAIYDIPTGGSPVWSETNGSVQVKGGLFSVLLGSVINLPANIFDNPDRWFAVRVGSDPEMAPRQKIASVGYAVKAASADLAATVPDAAITTAKVASAAITTDLIAAGAVTVDKLAPGIATPIGTVVMWSGSVADIPASWKLCDGANGTPDLKNRFIVGAGDEYVVAATGGEKLHTLSIVEMPSHQHEIHCGVDGSGSNGLMVNAADSITHLSTSYAYPTGGGQAHENRPPYYALCFIMKVSN